MPRQANEWTRRYWGVDNNEEYTAHATCYQTSETPSRSHGRNGEASHAELESTVSIEQYLGFLWALETKVSSMNSHFTEVMKNLTDIEDQS